YKYDLALGRLTPFGQLQIPNHKIEGEGKTFGYIRNLDFAEFRAAGRTIFIMNATDADYFSGRVRGPKDVTTYSAQIYNRFLEPEPGESIVTTSDRGLLNLDFGVQQGGVIRLRALDGPENPAAQDDTASPEIAPAPPAGFTPSQVSPRSATRRVGQ
ncbi:MAG: hypothetical protein HY646_13550, partial [Acidobacteria bacterium]|nr:hypothetical protein [Acidobacteriota bacterium]